MYIQGCGGGGLVPFPNWLLKPVPCKLHSPQHTRSPGLLCPVPHAASPLPSATHSSPAPGVGTLAPCPHTHPPPPQQEPLVFIWQSKAWQALWPGATARGPGLALPGCEIPLKPRGFLLLSGKHAEGLSGLGSYVLHMSWRRKMEIFSMSLFAL